MLSEIRALVRKESENDYILQMFEECHHQIKSIKRNTLYTATGVEEIIVQNLITYLSGNLQDLTSSFGRSQNDYLKRMMFTFLYVLVAFHMIS